LSCKDWGLAYTNSKTSNYNTIQKPNIVNVYLAIINLLRLGDLDLDLDPDFDLDLDFEIDRDLRKTRLTTTKTSSREF
jgi:hypothetical protein